MTNLLQLGNWKITGSDTTHYFGECKCGNEQKLSRKVVDDTQCPLCKQCKNIYIANPDRTQYVYKRHYEQLLALKDIKNCDTILKSLEEHALFLLIRDGSVRNKWDHMCEECWSEIYK